MGKKGEVQARNGRGTERIERRGWRRAGLEGTEFPKWLFFVYFDRKIHARECPTSRERGKTAIRRQLGRLDHSPLWYPFLTFYILHLLFLIVFLFYFLGCFYTYGLKWKCGYSYYENFRLL